MKAPTETALVNACLEYLRLRGIMAWRQNSGAARARNSAGRERFVRFHGAPGCSDILGILPPNGRLLAVECKVCGRRPTLLQQAFLENVRAAGGLAVVVRSIRELEAALED